MEKIGFIGLGIMGKPMCANLMKAGYELKVYDCNSEAVDMAVKLGAQKGESPKDVAAFASIIITMLPNSPHVKEVVLGENGILKGAKEGTIIADMSSIEPLEAQFIGAQAAKQGVTLLDAPVSGGEPKAIDGSLAIMVGGPKEAFDKLKPLFDIMGSSATLVGDLGAGNITKLANQIIVAINIAAVGEALTLASKAGVDPQKVYEAIRGGLAGSTVLDAKAPMMIERNFAPGFRINLHIKDLDNILKTAHGIGVPAPLSASVMEMMQALKVDGYEMEDHSSLVKFFEKLANITVGEDS